MEEKKGKRKVQRKKRRRQCMKIGTVWQGPETRRQGKKHGKDKVREWERRTRETCTA